MAKYPNGIYGPLKGKIGSLVASSWLGKPYLKQHNPGSGRKRTELQKVSQSRLSFISHWHKPIAPLIRIGFAKYAPGQSGWNSGQSYNRANALIIHDESLEMDYSAVRFSYGPLKGASEVKLEVEAEKLLIHWTSDIPAPGTRRNEDDPSDGDSVMFFVYCPAMAEAIIDIGTYKRKEERAEVLIPPVWKDQRLEIQIGFRSPITTEVSISQYAGRLN